MGRSPCCEKAHTNKGAWTKEEDQQLISYIRTNGEGCWRALPKAAGLARCGKSCRLRWINYLRPDLKRGNFSEEEDDAIIKLHAVVGNKWSLIAARLPGRTDNEIKNYWNTHIKRKLLNRGIDPQTHRPVMANADGGVAGVVTPTSSHPEAQDGPEGTSTKTPTFADHARGVTTTIQWKAELVSAALPAVPWKPVVKSAADPQQGAASFSVPPPPPPALLARVVSVKPEPTEAAVKYDQKIADGSSDQSASSSISSVRSAVEDNDPTTTYATGVDWCHRSIDGDCAPSGIDLNLSISLPSYTSRSYQQEHSPSSSEASFTKRALSGSPTTTRPTTPAAPTISCIGGNTPYTSQHQQHQQAYAYYQHYPYANNYHQAAAAAPSRHAAPVLAVCLCAQLGFRNTKQGSPTTATTRQRAVE